MAGCARMMPQEHNGNGDRYNCGVLTYIHRAEVAEVLGLRYIL